MSPAERSSDGREDDRSAQMAQVLAEVAAQRQAGQDCPDAAVCAVHPELMPNLVEGLKCLRLVQRARGYAQPPLPTETGSLETAPALQPDSFAGYQMVREIHRGGQGVVYQAIQKSTHRKVALKVMREGPFATPAEQARFEREVQVLGQLNHPHIVAIHDSGQAAGCHYFVMEYISGQPLNVWMASGVRSIEETLRLFAKVCHAINAAHLRGITHRDLKPGNIRVDENGEPRVLDFGLAKVATPFASSSSAGLEGEAPPMTLTGQFVGSLPWASPEQAEGMPSKIDLRTDVYSLGVILYQMLTGRFPYEVVGNMRDVLDRIMTAEPARPSTIGWRGRSGRGINDEIETIVLKCLSKERDRRYQSAGELARDIGHYLAGEPIEAKRDSAAYVLRKYLRTYRLPTAIAAGFVVVVTVGLVASLTFWRQAVVAQGHAEERRRAAEWSSARTLVEAERADREANQAKRQAAIAESLNKLMNDMLAKANRGLEKGNPNVTVREVMDIAAHELEAGATRHEPEVEAALRMTLGQTYQALGLYDEAETHLRAALAEREALAGRESLGVAEVLEGLSRLLMDKGHKHVAEARPLAEEAVAIRRKLLGNEHPAVAAALHNLGTVIFEDADRAQEVLSEALALRRKLFGDESLAVADTLSSLATEALIRGEWESAERLLHEALALRRRLLGNEHLDIAGNLNDIGVILSYRGDFVGAEPLYQEALAMYRKFLGDEHPLVAMVANHLGVVLYKRGDLAGAERLLREGLEIRRKLAKEDPQLAYSARNLGVLVEDRGDYAEAEALFREALGVFDQHGYNSADDCVARIGLGIALTHLGRFSEAAPVFIDADARLAALPYDPNAAVRASASRPALRWRALSSLVDLYERWHTAEPGQGHDRQAAEWRAKLAEWQASTQPATQRDTQPTTAPVSAQTSTPGGGRGRRGLGERWTARDGGTPGRCQAAGCHLDDAARAVAVLHGVGWLRSAAGRSRSACPRSPSSPSRCASVPSRRSTGRTVRACG